MSVHNGMPSYKHLRRRYRSILLSLLAVFCIIFLILYRHERAKDHYLSSDLVNFSPNLEAGQQTILTRPEAQRICKDNGFPVYKSVEKRKVYDVTLINTELDWLEIRLQTLSPYVDYFIVVESDTTFTHKPKPLHLKENWDKFKEFHHKIIHRIVHDPIISERVWDHEDWIRNAMFYEVAPGLVGTPSEMNEGDALLVSDMDEIIRPGVAVLLRHCDFPRRLILRLDFYYYSYQWRHIGPQWPHPDVTIYRGIGFTIPPNDLRQGLLGPLSWFGETPYAAFRRWYDRATIHNAGWHCSSCFATVAQMKDKMGAFAHAPSVNTPKNRDTKTLMSRVRNGEDLFGRPDQKYERIENNRDVPPYLLEQNEKHGRFKYMLDRDGEDAGFEDGLTAI